MPPKSRFVRLDAFTKTVEDARIRTTSGGIVTIVSMLVVLYLVWGEWADYRRVVVKPELIVDKSRGEVREADPQGMSLMAAQEKEWRSTSIYHSLKYRASS